MTLMVSIGTEYRIEKFLACPVNTAAARLGSLPLDRQFMILCFPARCSQYTPVRASDHHAQMLHSVVKIAVTQSIIDVGLLPGVRL